MKKIIHSLLIAAASVVLFGCDNDDDFPAPTITERAASTSDLSTLVTALRAAGLDSTLDDNSAVYTVFAPTNSAFEKIDSDALNALLADTDKLRDVLLYHVISGSSVGSAAAVNSAGSTIDMANGDKAALSLDGSNLLVNFSTVTATDIEASNGVVHTLDTVLMPPADAGTPENNIVETAIAAGSVTTLVAALQAAGLDGALSDETKKYTVFAPTDAAFDKLPAGTVASLLGDIPALSKILTTHVIADQQVDSITALSLNGKEATMLSGTKLPLKIADGSLMVGSAAKVTTYDIYTNNGIIHVIDTVITD